MDPSPIEHTKPDEPSSRPFSLPFFSRIFQEYPLSVLRAARATVFIVGLAVVFWSFCPDMLNHWVDAAVFAHHPARRLLESLDYLFFFVWALDIVHPILSRGWTQSKTWSLSWVFFTTAYIGVAIIALVLVGPWFFAPSFVFATTHEVSQKQLSEYPDRVLLQRYALKKFPPLSGAPLSQTPSPVWSLTSQETGSARITPLGNNRYLVRLAPNAYRVFHTAQGISPVPK